MPGLAVGAGARAYLSRYPSARLSVQAAEYTGRPNLVAVLPGSKRNRTIGPSVSSSTATPTRPARPCGGVATPPTRRDHRGWAHAWAGGGGCQRMPGDIPRCAPHTRAAGITLRRRVMVQSVVDEEMGGAGALGCVERGYRAPIALVGKPSGFVSARHRAAHTPSPSR